MPGEGPEKESPCAAVCDSEGVHENRGLLRDRGREVGMPSTSRAAERATPAKRVFFFGNGRAEGAGLGKERLGGKGAGLSEMTALGIPVPPGFTIDTSVCLDFLRTGSLEGLRPEVEEALARLEGATGRKFGDAGDPLLVSVRSGARSSMPGMMDTILNLGLTSAAVKGLAAAAGERFALDCRRRFLQMYSDIVLGIPRHDFEEFLTRRKEEKRAASDANLTAEDLRWVVERYEEVVQRHGASFPDDPREQLWGAIGAVFRSWDNPRAKEYRRLYRIPEHWGTAVNVQAMVFGNRGESSATGVAFTRNPATGEKRFYGEFLANAQGEDVVAGIRTPHPLAADGSGASLEETMPEAYGELLRVRDLVEKSFRDMQDLEFTIEEEKLYLLQTRNGKRTGFAAVRIATDMVAEGLISEDEAVTRVEPEQLVQLLAPVFPAKEKEAAVKEGRLLAKGLPAGPGAACGRIAFTADHAVEMARKGDPVVLVRVETSPEDIAGMHAAVGILTTRGGMTSHASVVARGMGKTCVVGAGEITVDEQRRELSARDLSAKEGDFLSVDGTTGEILLGKLSTQPSEVLQVLVDGTLAPEKSPLFGSFQRLLEYADRRPGGAALRRRGHRSLPHGAHVLRREPNRGGAPDDRRRFRGGSSEGSREAPPDAARRLRRDLTRDGGEAGHDPPPRSAPPRVPASRGRGGEEDGRGARHFSGEAPRSRPRSRRSQPDARPPRMPARDHVPRDLRDAGSRDLRGRRGRATRGGAPEPRGHDPARRHEGRVRSPPRPRGRDGAESLRRDARGSLLPRWHDDRDPARGTARGGDRRELRLLLLRDERPDPDDVRLLARRRGVVSPHLCRA